MVHKNYKHGESNKTITRLYKIWGDIKSRCLNPNCKSYKYYGGRGITIFPEWVNDYTKFKDWSLNNEYADNLVIDRIDNNGNYEPNNCRWVTKLESNRNKRNTITLQIANEIRDLYKTGDYTQQQLAEKYVISQNTISKIIRNKFWK